MLLLLWEMRPFLCILPASSPCSPFIHPSLFIFGPQADKQTSKLKLWAVAHLPFSQYCLMGPIKGPEAFLKVEMAGSLCNLFKKNRLNKQVDQEAWQSQGKYWGIQQCPPPPPPIFQASLFEVSLHILQFGDQKEWPSLSCDQTREQSACCR